VPRLVNQVCDRALMLADARRLEKIDAAVVQAAWSDLQQLPTPWEASQESLPHAAAAASVVEFGSLDEKSLAYAAPATSAPVAFCGHPAIVEPIESDDDEPVAPPAAPARASASAHRPRVFREATPDAVDPFAESFEEEELVLDTFATLASIFLPRTPRVENRREPGFSRLVQNALDAALATADLDEMAAEKHATIRLAVVADSPAPATDSRPRPARDMSVELADFDAPFAENFRASHIGPPSAPNSFAQRGGAAAPAMSSNHPDHLPDAILVIEDEPEYEAAAPSGVRRENYRQLFSRLRHGT